MDWDRFPCQNIRSVLEWKDLWLFTGTVSLKDKKMDEDLYSDSLQLKKTERAQTQACRMCIMNHRCIVCPVYGRVSSGFVPVTRTRLVRSQDC